MTEWETSPVNELCSDVVDCVNKTAPSVPGPTPYKMLRTTNVRSGWIDTDSVRFVERPVFERWTRRLLPRRGDVVLTREAPLGEVGMIRSDDELFLGQRLVLYRADPDRCDARFLLYAFLAPAAQAELRRLGSGSTVEHLRVPDCEIIPILHPPLEGQRRIGAVLGAIDDLIENNRRRVELLEQMAQAIYREWFVHFRFPGHEDSKFVDSPLGPIPHGWDVNALSAIAEEVRVSVKPSDETEALPYVPIDSIDAKSVTLRSFRPGSEAASSLRLFEAGDVLFGAMRAYFHKVCIAPFRGVTRSTCFVLRPAPDRYHFAAMTLADPETVAYAAAHSTGSTIPYAKWSGVLSEMPIRRPPATVAGAFGDAVAPLLVEAQKLVPQNRGLESIRDLLLPKLVTGQIDVSELDPDALVEAVV